MLLVAASSTRLADSPDLQAGIPVGLHFSVASPDGHQHFRTQAVVARISEDGNGIGVRFVQGLQADAFEALLAFAVASGTATVASGDAEDGSDDAAEGIEIPESFLRDARINHADAVRVRARVRAVTNRAMERMGTSFLKFAKEDLLRKARDAGTNAVQMMYLEGLDLIEQQGEAVVKRVSENVVGQVEEVSKIEDVLEKQRRRQTGESQKLELVDTEQFEDWLAVAEIISKSENRYSESLLDVRALLGMLAKPWSHKDVVPVGPAVIMWAFDDAVRDFDLRRQVRNDVYRNFEAAMAPMLGHLYDALVKLLGDSAVFPSIEEIRRKLQSSVVRRSASGVRLDPKQYEDMDSSVRQAAMAADGVASTRADFNPFDAEASTGRHVYHTARNLIALSRDARSRRGEQVDDLLADAGAANADLFDSQDILHALSDLEQELGETTLSDRRLRPRLIESLKRRHGERKALSVADYDTLEMMENLVASITQDRFITEGIRDWVQRLEITLNKLAARDPAFLQHEPDAPHSAVQMLNQLARLGNGRDVRDGIDREVGRRVDELLDRVVKEYDENPEVFTQVVDELHPLVDKQSQAYRGNVERTIRASEGQQKLARARRAVLTELELRLENQQVPELLLELLNPGWRNLLVHSHLRHGVESNLWRDQLAVVDQIFGQLNGSMTADDAGHVDGDVLLRRVVDGLNSISFDPSKRTPLVMKLSAVLVGDTTGRKTPAKFVSVAPGELVNLLGFEGLLPELEPESESQDEDVQRDFEKAVARARRIQVGEWLAKGDAQGRPLILTVAFVGDNQASFVLVNRRGIKNSELDLAGMAKGLHEGQITLLDDYDLPLMERASQRMLENMHSQLAFQASHDDLTQLLNRKEFEREVLRTIAEAARDDHLYTLLYLDLDQFKIINNTSGHTAGDELLRAIGNTLSELLEKVRGKVARLGGDEFGVLFRASSTRQARTTADEVLQAIREQRFEWEGRQYNLSTSIGLVFIDKSTESVDAVMRHADEACYTAKDAGRNRVQEYELDDARMIRRHGVMEWVAQLDKALDENRLVLNCQRIASIANREQRTEGHYEILLTMMDELGETMPPTEFILAAETYNRMTMVDRWVIEHVLAWLAEHRDRLDHFGGFSINVSGHSVNDETFPTSCWSSSPKRRRPRPRCVSRSPKRRPLPISTTRWTS